MNKIGQTLSTLFTEEKSVVYSRILSLEYPWLALCHIREWIREIGDTLSGEEYEKAGESIWISKSAKVSATAKIMPYTIIGANTEIRHCAFIRGNAIIGNSCVIGNSCEVKNSIIFDNAQIPHFNYVGDSIIGYFAHLGAGAITSNVKSDKTAVTVRCYDETVNTGLKKLGAIVGDYAEIGCGAVLNPGTVVGRCTNVYPLSSVRGVIPAYSIYKSENETVRKES